MWKTSRPATAAPVAAARRATGSSETAPASARPKIADDGEHVAALHEPQGARLELVVVGPVQAAEQREEREREEREHPPVDVAARPPQRAERRAEDADGQDAEHAVDPSART